MPQSPRGTYLQISESLRQKIETGKISTALPSEAELMRTYGVGRSTVGRALALLKSAGLIESSQGSGWYVAGTTDRRPLVEKITALLVADGLRVGDPFPSENDLCQRFGVSRTAVRSAVSQLEGRGLIGKSTNRRREVRALPPGRLAKTNLPQQASSLAESLLTELPRRWAHSLGVWERAQELRPILGEEADLVEAAAVLHDIGYSPRIAETGFHPLDGARFLRDQQAIDERVVRLVAHHSCALLEAEERGLHEQLEDEFEIERPDLVDAIIYCDMTTSPDGTRVTPQDRLSEIEERYGADTIVSRFIRRAAPEIHAAVRRVEERLAAQTHGQPM